jgi:hypothetical protein
MIAMIQQAQWNDDWADTEWEEGGIERLRRQGRGDFPVRSHAAQTRAKSRSLATPAAKRKARSFQGANYRGSHRHWTLKS